MRLLFLMHGLALLQIYHACAASVLPIRALADPSTEHLSPLTAISKRAWPNPHQNFFVLTQAAGLSFFLRFNVLELVEPGNNGLAIIAAHDLVRFYKAVFAVAGAVWAHDQPRTVRRARIEGVLLMFWSDAPIAWEFLQAFFEHIIDRTQGGLVGGYDITCVAEIGTAIVHVNLQLPLGHFAQAAPAAKPKLQ